MSDAHKVTLTVNGDAREFSGSPMARLLDVLRQSYDLIGTKEGCGEGECGACTVLLDGEAVCACLVPIFQCEGRDVVTVEGIARAGELDPIQRIFVRDGGVQCGACTPGMVVTARALLDRFDKPDRDTIRDHLAGTLCRCTGYERILQAVEAVIEEQSKGAAG